MLRVKEHTIPLVQASYCYAYPVVTPHLNLCAHDPGLLRNPGKPSSLDLVLKPEVVGNHGKVDVTCGLLALWLSPKPSVLVKKS